MLYSYRIGDVWSPNQIFLFKYFLCHKGGFSGQKGLKQLSKDKGINIKIFVLIFLFISYMIYNIHYILWYMYYIMYTIIDHDVLYTIIYPAYIQVYTCIYYDILVYIIYSMVHISHILNIICMIYI